MATIYRQLGPEDMPSAAGVHRAAFDERLPWLAGLHTASEDVDFFRGRIFKSCVLWGAFEEGRMIGIVAFREGWIDQLYVLPTAQRRGIGRALLKIAQGTQAVLSLWTFQKNLPARRFYESHGFVISEKSDGADNEEKEPAFRYSWSREPAP